MLPINKSQTVTFGALQFIWTAGPLCDKGPFVTEGPAQPGSECVKRQLVTARMPTLASRCVRRPLLRPGAEVLDCRQKAPAARVNCGGLHIGVCGIQAEMQARFDELKRGLLALGKRWENGPCIWRRDRGVTSRGEAFGKPCPILEAETGPPFPFRELRNYSSSNAPV